MLNTFIEYSIGTDSSSLFMIRLSDWTHKQESSPEAPTSPRKVLEYTQPIRRATHPIKIQSAEGRNDIKLGTYLA